MKRCSDHSGMCEKLVHITGRLDRTATKIDRMEWFIIATLGVSFVGLLFNMVGRVSASGH